MEGGLGCARFKGAQPCGHVGFPGFPLSLPPLQLPAAATNVRRRFYCGFA